MIGKAATIKFLLYNFFKIRTLVFINILISGKSCLIEKDHSRFFFDHDGCNCYYYDHLFIL